MVLPSVTETEKQQPPPPPPTTNPSSNSQIADMAASSPNVKSHLQQQQQQQQQPSLRDLKLTMQHASSNRRVVRKLTGDSSSHNLPLRGAAGSVRAPFPGLPPRYPRSVRRPERKSSDAALPPKKRAKFLIRLPPKSIIKPANDVAAADAGRPDSHAEVAEVPGLELEPKPKPEPKIRNLRSRRPINKKPNAHAGALKIGGAAAPDTKAEAPNRPELSHPDNAKLAAAEKDEKEREEGELEEELEGKEKEEGELEEKLEDTEKEEGEVEEELKEKEIEEPNEHGGALKIGGAVAPITQAVAPSRPELSHPDNAKLAAAEKDEKEREEGELEEELEEKEEGELEEKEIEEGEVEEELKEKEIEEGEVEDELTEKDKEKGKEIEGEKEIEEEERKEEDRGKENEDAKELEFRVQLNQEEIEEDFFAICGSSYSLKPGKIDEHVQKAIERLFPGRCLNGKTLYSYEVHEPRIKD